MKKILEVNGLKVHFTLGTGLLQRRRTVYAVDGVSFSVFAGETLGIVGESGCGKTTLARALCGLNKISAGSAMFNEEIELATATKEQWTAVHKQMQFIFQDPIAALDPRMSVAEIIAEPLRTLYPKLPQQQIIAKVIATMKLVGLNSNDLNRYPLEFSGGQCQRIGIARALILDPQILICDEAVSALDLSIKAQIINLLQELQHKLQLTIIFISHDLGIVQHISTRILVMYLGQVMELADGEALYKDPLHPYTKALLAAVPVADPTIEQQKTPQLLEGDLPSPINPPHGCVFSTRCPLADAQCRQARPQSKVIKGHDVACYKVTDLAMDTI